MTVAANQYLVTSTKTFYGDDWHPRWTVQDILTDPMYTTNAISELHTHGQRGGIFILFSEIGIDAFILGDDAVTEPGYLTNYVPVYYSLNTSATDDPSPEYFFIHSTADTITVDGYPSDEKKLLQYKFDSKYDTGVMVLEEKIKATHSSLAIDFTTTEAIYSNIPNVARNDNALKAFKSLGQESAKKVSSLDISPSATRTVSTTSGY